MAPLSFIQNPGLRLILMIAIISNLLLSALTLWRQLTLADAMATSQINVVEKVGNVDRHVSNVSKDVMDMKTDVALMKANVLSDMSVYTALGESRQKENNDKFAIIEARLGSLDAKAAEATDAANEATVAANSATKAAKATHAKVSQKIITGPEADALKRAAKKKTTVYKIWPWQ